MAIMRLLLTLSRGSLRPQKSKLRRLVVHHTLLSRNISNYQQRECISIRNSNISCELITGIKSPMSTHQTASRSYSSSDNGKAIKFMLSDIGEGITEVVIREWFIKVGDHVKQFDSICEVQSDKASVTITSRFDGLVSKIYHDVDGIAKVGHPLIEIIIDDGNAQPSQTLSKAPVDQAPLRSELHADTQEQAKRSLDEDNQSLASIPTIPAVRRLAKEHGIDLRLVEATGKKGRVTKEDVLSYLDGKRAFEKKSEPLVSAKSSERTRLKGVRLAMFKSMTSSLDIPHFSLSEEIDVTHLSEFVRELKKSKKGPSDTNSPRVNHLAFMVKICSLCLTRYPMMNGSVEHDGDEKYLVQKPDHNIGIAIDTQQGLVVPNIKNVQLLSITDIASELERLKDASVQKSLSPQDVDGGTFSISNIGSIGGIRGYPVIMSPQVAIGAVGRIRSIPRFDNQGCVVPREIMDVVWSADHRVIDGATMTRFSNLWRDYMENLPLMAVELK